MTFDTFVKNDLLLRKPCEPVKFRREGGIVARRLWAELARYNKRAKNWPGAVLATGLSAPQVGIFKQVCVIDIGTPLLLVNPTIVAHSEVKLPWEERCPSFPGRTFQTFRWPWVEVATDTTREIVRVGPSCPEEWSRESIARAVCAQHEMAHLFGALPMDFAREDCPWK